MRTREQKANAAYAANIQMGLLINKPPGYSPSYTNATTAVSQIPTNQPASQYQHQVGQALYTHRTK